MEIQQSGYVDKIMFRNEENGYTVLSLKSAKDETEITCVGSFPFLSEGDYIDVKGEMGSHAVYGEQLKMLSYEQKEPEDVEGMERYLGSGAIKGIGKTLAARIIKHFGENTFHIIEDEPERLAEVKGISEKMAREIYRQFYEKQGMRNALIFLQQYGISGNLAVKIFKFYGDRMYRVIRENPYQIAEDIDRVGFKITDEIAVKAGMRPDSEARIKAGVLYVLNSAIAGGHVYLPYEILTDNASQLLSIDEAAIEPVIESLWLSKKIFIKELENCPKAVYNSMLYYMELNVARMLLDLNIRVNVPDEKIIRRIEMMEKESGFELDRMQKTAVIEAAKNGLFILTGGPGTGKTTTINAIINYFEAEGEDIILAAPTGRAAKRMSETTGHEARTIHRLLELMNGGEDNSRSMLFNRNEENPLETDVIIIDEMSMVDILLMNALLKAVSVGTRLILVGDVNQLPSVGPGNILHDIIASHCFNVVKLQKIFRQASESDIIVNAHKINDGEKLDLSKKSGDFFFLERQDVNSILGVVISLIRDKLPKHVGATASEIQVLTPMKKGELGVERLNNVLQEYLNPKDDRKNEHEAHGVIFREGDKVMQIKNNYQLEWEIVNRYNLVEASGMGVFNGDMGVVKEINQFAEYVRVIFDEGRGVNYSFSQLDELELAYAVTVHKSQGSEYPAVILPILGGPKLLFHRNILYTAVTRAKSCVAIVGSSEQINFMIDNERENLRYTGLSEWIAGLQ